jgi:hypothetical protein
MKFGNEFWLILFREYISPNLFAVLLYRGKKDCRRGKGREPLSPVLAEGREGGGMLGTQIL